MSAAGTGGGVAAVVAVSVEVVVANLVPPRDGVPAPVLVAPGLDGAAVLAIGLPGVAVLLATLFRGAGRAGAVAGLAAAVFVLAAVGLGAAVFVAAVPLAMGLVGVRVAEAVGFGFISPLVVAAAVLAAEVAAGRLGALEVFAGAETTRRVGVEEVADAGRAVEVLAAGLAGDEVFDGDAADVPFTADVALFGGAAVTVRVVVVVVVVVVFLTVDVAAETIGLVAGLVVAGAAFGAVLVCLEGVVEDGAAGVAFLNGDSLVGRAGLAASADEVLASVVATRRVVGSGFLAGSFAAGLAAGLEADFAVVVEVFFAAAIGFLAAGDLAFAAATAAVATPIAVPVTTKAGTSEPIVAESETGLSTSRGSIVSSVLVTSTSLTSGTASTTAAAGSGS